MAASKTFALLRDERDDAPDSSSRNSGSLFILASIQGTPGDDTLLGTAAADTIEGLDGDDLLLGLGGDDTLVGGNGRDQLEGGAGADVLDGGAGPDYARYASATSGVVFDLANPAVNRGDAAGDTPISIESILGSSYADRLFGDAGANTIGGFGGADILEGREGNDALLGGDGHDLLAGGAGADLLDGGTGVDRVTYESEGAVVASLAAAAVHGGAAAGDHYVNVEGLIGSNFADVLFGNDFANILLGRDGNDYIEGGGGNDSIAGDGGDDELVGGAGADIISGGSGFDYASYVHAPNGIEVDLMLPAANTGEALGDTHLSVEGIFGTAFNDRVTGDDVANDLRGGGGHDVVDGRGGNDRLAGGDGDDAIWGRDGDDLIDGGAGGDFINGAAGYDTVTYASAAEGVIVSLESPAANTGDAAGDRHIAIEAFIGSAFNDTLVMDAAHNIVEGAGGDDVL
ncbi:MAG TPA: calcium-binding protein, partial [Burkholderiales bacterium]|nr:calcium-binding protein [Burkholderiales bacterium]